MFLIYCFLTSYYKSLQLFPRDTHDGFVILDPTQSCLLMIQILNTAKP